MTKSRKKNRTTTHNAPFTAEFRESAVKLAVESEDSISKTARELGINVNTLHTWIGKYHRNNESSSKAASEFSQEHLYDELKRLKKENAKLKEEQAILKKAAAYFARESL